MKEETRTESVLSHSSSSHLQRFCCEFFFREPNYRNVFSITSSPPSSFHHSHPFNRFLGCLHSSLTFGFFFSFFVFFSVLVHSNFSMFTRSHSSSSSFYFSVFFFDCCVPFIHQTIIIIEKRCNSIH